MTRTHRQVLKNETTARIASDLAGAVRRRPQREERLAGIVRALAPWSDEIRDAGLTTLETLVKRGATDRPLYAGLLRGLARAPGELSEEVTANALELPEGGGYPALSAACFLEGAKLAAPLARVASTRHPHLSFAAEVARLARREGDGEHLRSIAPRIKESHRIALCTEVFVPLLHAPPLPKQIGASLDILRVTERHLGRWLVFAEISVLAGNDEPLVEARKRAEEGTSSTKNAWNLVCWALTYDAPPPTTRPNVEIVSRLSDRPSAKRDTTFLFRMADAGAKSARPMLEGMVKHVPLSTEVAIRAAGYLMRDHGRDDLGEALLEAAKSAKSEDLRGLATAAMWDAGMHDQALEQARKLGSSRSLVNAAWSLLVQSAAEYGATNPVVTEENFRHVQMEWVI